MSMSSKSGFALAICLGRFQHRSFCLLRLPKQSILHLLSNVLLVMVLLVFGNVASVANAANSLFEPMLSNAGPVPTLGGGCVQGVGMSNIAVGETRAFYAAQTTTASHVFTGFVGTPGFTGTTIAGKLGLSLSQSGPYTESIAIPASPQGAVVLYLKGLAAASPLYLQESGSDIPCIWTNTFAVTAAPPTVGQASIVSNWNVTSIGQTQTVKVEVNYGPANFNGFITLRERRGDRVQFASTEGGSYGVNVLLPIRLDSTGRGFTEPAYVKGATPSQAGDNPSAALMTLAVASSGTTKIEAAPPYPIRVDGVAKILANWSALGIEHVQPIRIEVQGAKANQSDLYSISERNFQTSLNQGSPINPFLSFASAPNGPFFSILNVALQTNNVGYGITQTIYVKGLRDSVDITPQTAITAVGTNLIANVPVLPTPPMLPIFVTEPIVNFNLDTYKIGVDIAGTGFVNVFYGVPNSTAMITLTTNTAEAASVKISAQLAGPFASTLQLPVQLDATGSGRTPNFFMKNSIGSTHPDNALHASYFSPQMAQLYSDTARVYGVRVFNMTLRSHGSNAVLDANPGTIRGDLRIFPDLETATETNTARDYVEVVAKLGAAVSGVYVFFNAYDIDDPSADSTIDPNGNRGEDNRGAGSGFVGDHWAITNSLGEAKVKFAVSHQPGDNFRFAAYAVGAEGAVASASPGFAYPAWPTISGTQLVTGQGPVAVANMVNATDIILASVQLTVWRRLHLEYDSMGAVSGNSLSKTIMLITPEGTGSRVSFGGFPLPLARFENGTLEIKLRWAPGSKKYHISESNLDSVLTTTPVLSNALGLSLSATIFDDDGIKTSVSEFPSGDIGRTAGAPALNWLGRQGYATFPVENKMATAYILPVYDLPSGYERNVPFVLNCPQTNAAANAPTDAELRSLTKFDNWSFQGQDYWIAYLLGAYQGPELSDGDPDTEDVFLSLSTPKVGAIIFTETNNDHFNAVFDPANADYELENDPRFVAIRALGISLGLHGVDGGLMSGESAEFSPISITKLRSNVFPRVGAQIDL
jgi:hypothetical protein